MPPCASSSRGRFWCQESVFCSLSTVSSVFLSPLLLAKASVFLSKMQYKNTVKTYIHVTEIHARDLHLRKNAAALRVGHYIQRHSLIFFPGTCSDSASIRIVIGGLSLAGEGLCSGKNIQSRFSSGKT